MNWRKHALHWALLLFFFLVICLTTGYKSSHLEGKKFTDMQGFVNGTILYHDGSEKAFRGTEFGQINKGDVIRLQVSLPMEKKTNPGVLAFGINHAVVNVRYGDTLLVSFGADIAARGDMICHRNYFVEIPGEAWGESIEIELTATEDKAFNRIRTFWLYPAAESFHFYFDLEFGRFFVAVSVMLFSAGALVIAFFLARQDKKQFYRILCVSVLGLFSSFYITLAEGLQQFFDIDSYFITTLEFVLLPAMMIPLGFYILIGEFKKKYRQILRAVLYTDIAYIITICLMNYLNIAHFSRTVAPSAILVCINSVFFLIHAIRNLDFGKLSQRIRLMGVSVISLTGLYDLIRFILYRSTASTHLNRTENTFPIGAMFFFMCLLFSLVIQSRENQEYEKQQHLKLLTSQMHPHFMYNTLASIQEIIFEDPEYASTILGNFTVYLRGAVKSLSDVSLIPFREEMKNIHAYMEIEKVRLAERLEVKMDLKSLGFKVPPLSIQPLVENAIIHGIYPKGEAGGLVIIRSFENDRHWIVEIEDNGVGFNVEETMKNISKRKSDSIGMKNAFSRLQDSVHADISLKSSAERGTVVTIYIPKTRKQNEDDPS